MECGFDTYKNALIENLVILFVFFCAVEPIYSFFKFQSEIFIWFQVGFLEKDSIRVLFFNKSLNSPD